MLVCIILDVDVLRDYKYTHTCATPSFVVMDPFTCIVSGPTGCGKSVFVFKLLTNLREMITPLPQKVLYCYGEYQKAFASYPWVEFYEGLPKSSMFDGTPMLVIIDDLMHETNDMVANLFTKISHHRSVSVIYITQNIFHKCKQSRTISLNAHYMILFKSPRDVGQIAILGRQLYPENRKFLVEAFKDATSEPHSYLMLDLKPDTCELYRVRASIFSMVQQVVYLPK